jgi:hypothetical protein
MDYPVITLAVPFVVGVVVGVAVFPASWQAGVKIAVAWVVSKFKK